MDTKNKVTELCLKGTRAEFEGKKELALEIYKQAWEISKSDYEYSMSAHYLGHIYQIYENTQESFYWHEKALEFALLSDSPEIKNFLPSLYLNMGRVYESQGKISESKNYYNLAIKYGHEISDDYGDMIEKSVNI